MQVRLVKGCKDVKGLEAHVLQRDKTEETVSPWRSYQCVWIPCGKEQRGNQPQSQDKRQWAWNEIQEFAFKHEENLSWGVVKLWNRLAGGGGVSVLGGRQDLIKYDPGQFAVGDPNLSRELQSWFFRDLFQPQILWSKDFEDMFIFQVSLKHTVHLYLSL